MSTFLFLAWTSSSREVSIRSVSTRLLPTPTPWAARNVYAMAPPMARQSTRSSRLVITGILSDTLAPPRIAMKGCSGFSSALDRYATSFCMRKPMPAGRRCATPSVEACARWAAPKASLTYRSLPAASALAKTGSFFFSPGWKRRFSRRMTSPSFMAVTAVSTSGPTQSARHATGRPINSERRLPAGARRMDSTTSPLGRPRWLQSTRRPP